MYRKKLILLILFFFIFISLSACASAKITHSDNAFYVFFDCNNGDVILPVKVEGDNAIVLPKDPVMPGYTFRGWYFDDETFKKSYNSADYTFSKDFKLYARWVENDKKKLIYNNYRIGSTDIYLLISVGSLVKPEIPQRYGYHFLGWEYQGEFFASESNYEFTMPNEDVNLYCNWESTFTYLISNNELNITGYGYPEPNILVIPAYIDNYPVKNIGPNSFSESATLIEISFEEGSLVEKIDQSAFYNCKNLSKITLPSSLKEISNTAFKKCENLNNIIIPDNVLKIEFNAFEECENLAIVIIERSSSAGITTCGQNIFYSCLPSLKIYVPDVESVTAYKEADNWSDYENLIYLMQ